VAYDPLSDFRQKYGGNTDGASSAAATQDDPLAEYRSKYAPTPEPPPDIAGTMAEIGTRNPTPEPTPPNPVIAKATAQNASNARIYSDQQSKDLMAASDKLPPPTFADNSPEAISRRAGGDVDQPLDPAAQQRADIEQQGIMEARQENAAAKNWKPSERVPYSTRAGTVRPPYEGETAEHYDATKYGTAPGKSNIGGNLLDEFIIAAAPRGAVAVATVAATGERVAQGIWQLPKAIQNKIEGKKAEAPPPWFAQKISAELRSEQFRNDMAEQGAGVAIASETLNSISEQALNLAILIRASKLVPLHARAAAPWATRTQIATSLVKRTALEGVKGYATGYAISPGTHEQRSEAGKQFAGMMMIPAGASGISSSLIRKTVAIAGLEAWSIPELSAGVAQAEEMAQEYGGDSSKYMLQTVMPSAVINVLFGLGTAKAKGTALEWLKDIRSKNPGQADAIAQLIRFKGQSSSPEANARKEAELRAIQGLKPKATTKAGSYADVATYQQEQRADMREEVGLPRMPPEAPKVEAPQPEQIAVPEAAQKPSSSKTGASEGMASIESKPIESPAIREAVKQASEAAETTPPEGNKALESSKQSSLWDGVDVDKPLPEEGATVVPRLETPAGSRITSVNRATLEEEMIKIGHELPPELQKETREAAMAKAEAKDIADPTAKDTYITHLIEGREGILNASDVMTIIRAKATRKAEVDSAEATLRQAEESGDLAGIANARNAFDLADARFNDVYRALEKGEDKAVTGLARALRALGASANENFDIVHMRAKAKSKKGWQDLTPEEDAKLVAFSEEAKASDAALQERTSQQEAKLELAKTESRTKADNAEFEKIVNSVLDAGGKTKSLTKRALTYLEAKEADLSNEWAKLDKEGEKLFSGPGGDPRRLDIAIQYGAIKVAKGVVRLAEWTDAMIAKFGEGVRPYLREARIIAMKQAKTTREEAEQSGIARKAARAIKNKVTGKKAEPTTEQTMVMELLRTEIQRGTRDLDTAIKNIVPEVRKDLPDATERSVRDAYSEYGKEKKPLKTDVESVTLAQWRREGQLQSQLDDLRTLVELKGRGEATPEKIDELRPKHSGQPRHGMSDKARAIQREAASTLRDLDIPLKETDPAKFLKSALAALKTRQQNEIRDLEKALRPGGSKIFRAKKGIILDADAKAAQIRLDELRADYKERYPAEPMSDAKRLQIWKKQLARNTSRKEAAMQAGKKPERVVAPKPPPDLATRELMAKKDIVDKKYKDFLDKLEWQGKTIFQKTGSGLVNTYDAARAIMTTGELSFIGRQAKFAALSHPIMTARALPNAIKALFAREARARAIDLETHLDPEAPRARKAGLAITDEYSTLTKQEEIGMGRWTRHIPIVKNFNNAARVFLNKIRLDVFKVLSKTTSKGQQPTPEEDAVFAMFANETTGRGGMGKHGERAAVWAGRILFSPRFLMSRLQIATGHALWTKGSTGRTRKVIATEYARMLIGWGVYNSALLMFFNRDKKQAKLGTEWTSSDFSKITIGNTRLDTMAGIAQVITLTARTIPQKRNGKWGLYKSTGEGNLAPLHGADVPYGGDHWRDVANRFAWSKAHPVLGSVANLFDGTDLAGDPADLFTEGSKFFAPITWFDIYGALKEQELPDATVLSLLAFAGDGLQTYKKKTSKSKIGKPKKFDIPKR